jgi:uncharacterized membrane-anchored protein
MSGVSKRHAFSKVPEVTAFFWIVKALTTAMGESTSDFLVHALVPEIAVVIGAVAFCVALYVQLGNDRYVPWAYWLAVAMVGVFGTMAADVLHVGLGVPYAVSTVIYALALALVFRLWRASEGTLSIHSITTQRREAFYWATVFATFALGTALGDFTATSLNLGYLASGILFSVVILLPALAWWKLGLNSIAAFWMAYIVTRPLGASFADYISKPQNLSGINFGDGPTALVFALAVLVLVSYLAMARPDIQQTSVAPVPDGRPAKRERELPLTDEPKLDVE